MVRHLKDVIKAKKANALKDVDADSLQLYLAKTDGAWLSSSTDGVKKLKEGMKTTLIEKLTQKDLELQGEDFITDVLKNMETPKGEQIHVLVVVSSGSVYLRVKEVDENARFKDELMHYQQRGEMIQRKCGDYCQQILRKIDALYAISEDFSLPFVCVQGSSGMGKSQLAFALGGSRPYFYWSSAPIGAESQRLYDNFSSISRAFRDMTNKDESTEKSEEDILNIKSDFYDTESLWTFGFICALLKYCSKDQNQQGKMLRFQEETSLYVEKCNRETVVTFREKMTGEGKVLPFFVLDEMTPNMHVGGGGKKLAAFQRNVFRVCGLVVIVMGTDAKITNLIPRSGGGYAEKYPWMTVISRFPPYQSIPFADDDKQTAWNRVDGRLLLSRHVLLAHTLMQ